MKLRRFCGMLLGGLLALLAAGWSQPMTSVREGDRIVWFGDSITHGGEYHLYLREYYLTRFPTLHFESVNRGISGDNAGHARQRLESDVLALRPNRVTVHFGMNDIGRGYYGKPETPELRQQRQAALERYAANLEDIVRKLTEAGIRVTVLSPTPYDETKVQPGENFAGCAGALAECGRIGRRIAEKYRAESVDWMTPMLAINSEVQKADPTDTIISGDRVHPRAAGHLIMAGLLLESQQAPGEVAMVRITPEGGATCRNARVENLTRRPGEVRFRYCPAALPFPKIKDLAKVDKWYGFTDKFNREMLQVTDLTPGNWQLFWDGVPAGEYSAAELAGGINLALLDASPGQRRAQQIRRLNRAFGDIESRFCGLDQVNWMLDGARVDRTDAAARQAYFADFLAKPRDNNRYFAGIFKRYEETLAQRPELEKRRTALLAEIDVLRQPVGGEIRLFLSKLPGNEKNIEKR